MIEASGNRLGHVADAGGRAESSHVLCAPCLERWFASQTALREESGLLPLTRRACPVCKSALRAAGAELRADADGSADGSAGGSAGGGGPGPVDRGGPSDSRFEKKGLVG